MSAIDELEVWPVTRLLRALGDETRLKIVALLSLGELCVCHLETGLGLSQPAVSRHLGVLKNGGVVTARREGTWVSYRLAEQPDADCARQLEAVVEPFRRSAKLKHEVRRLVKAKGPEACK